MALFTVRITSGEHTGRHVGPNVSGLTTNKELLNNREVRVPGTPYSLYAQHRAATRFLDHAARTVQEEFRKLGYDTELIIAGEE